MDFRAMTGLNRSDFRTISDFRKHHLSALSDPFFEVLRLCQRAGLLKLGHRHGTKLRANASRHKAMTYQRMLTEEPKLAAEVKAWLDQAEAADQTEEARHGRERRGDEMPAWLAGMGDVQTIEGHQLCRRQQLRQSLPPQSKRRQMISR
jgi:hypothetical protein